MPLVGLSTPSDLSAMTTLTTAGETFFTVGANVSIGPSKCGAGSSLTDLLSGSPHWPAWVVGSSWPPKDQGRVDEEDG